MILGVVLAIIAAVFATYLIGVVIRYGTEAGLQQDRETDVSNELAAARAEIRKLREEIEAVTQDRLPHLQKMRFDKVIPLQTPYVRNIVFTRTGDNDNPVYGYTIVLENHNLPPQLPKVSVQLFDRTGIQIGSDPVKIGGILRQGDSNSYSSEIAMTMPLEPIYFHVGSSTD